MKAWFTQSSLNSWCWDVCYLKSEKHLFGLQCLRLVTLINLSSAADLCKSPLGLPFLWRSSWEPVSSLCLMGFATALEETFKVLDIVHPDWHSHLKAMMNFNLSLLISAVLTIISNHILFLTCAEYNRYSEMLTYKPLTNNAVIRKYFKKSKR